MSSRWDARAAQSIVYSVDDFRYAAYQLLCSQVLYESVAGHATSYRIVKSNLSAFQDYFEDMGVEVGLVEEHQYCFARPRLARGRSYTVQETLMALVLRKLYHEQATTGVLDHGCAVVSLEQLKAAYTGATGRPWIDRAGELKALFRLMQRYGIARLQEEAGAEAGQQPYVVVIMPGIERLLDEAELARIAAFNAATPATADTDTAAQGTDDVPD